MAFNLCKAFTIIKSNILYVNCLVNNVRNFQSLRVTPGLLKYPKLTIFKKSNSTTKRSFTLLSCRRKTIEDVNLNIANNVLLFKHENTRYFKLLTALSISQLLLFFAISYALSPILPPRKDKPLLNYIMSAKLPLALVATPIICGIIGPIIMCMFIRRSIKYIVLNKGGKKVTLVTYDPLLMSPQITVPIEEVSVNRSRNDLGKYISIKVESQPFFYVLHRDGIFINPELFDNSIAFKRLI